MLVRAQVVSLMFRAVDFSVIAGFVTVCALTGVVRVWDDGTMRCIEGAEGEAANDA